LPEQVLPKALELAHELADGPVKAIQRTKMALNKRLMEYVNLILPTSTGFEYLSMHEADYQEAVSAFIQKRKPNFADRLSNNVRDILAEST
jgi:enoyl-CoA hydratase/carnithine racemase